MRVTVRKFEESTPDNWIVYEILGENYSESLVKTMLEETLRRAKREALQRKDETSKSG